MRLLDRYIARRVLRGYALIMVILVSGFSLIALVHELDSVGKGTYKTSDAALYVLLTLPGWMVELSAAVALLGAIVGLGELAAGEELTDENLCSIYEQRPQICRDFDCATRADCCRQQEVDGSCLLDSAS